MKRCYESSNSQVSLIQGQVSSKSSLNINYFKNLLVVIVGLSLEKSSVVMVGLSLEKNSSES